MPEGGGGIEEGDDDSRRAGGEKQRSGGRDARRSQAFIRTTASHTPLGAKLQLPNNNSSNDHAAASSAAREDDFDEPLSPFTQQVAASSFHRRMHCAMQVLTALLRRLGEQVFWRGVWEARGAEARRGGGRGGEGGGGREREGGEGGAGAGERSHAVD
eukprot:3153605-Rhodomonas_salina.3